MNMNVRMKTRTLELQELSLYNLPIDGTHITFFDSSSSFGMFEEHFTRGGEVGYMYGDIAETLEEALKKGGFISLQDDDNELAIPLSCDGYYLQEGRLWLYDHNYYPVLDKNHFPFQTWRYYEIALFEGWCELLGIMENGYGRAVTETHNVKFNDRIFYVVWNVVDGDNRYLHGFEIIGGDE
jgi:hypothetical protein